MVVISRAILEMYFGALLTFLVGFEVVVFCE